MPRSYKLLVPRRITRKGRYPNLISRLSYIIKLYTKYKVNWEFEIFYIRYVGAKGSIYPIS